MTLRTRFCMLTVSALACTLLLGSATPLPARASQGDGNGQLGLVGMDHVGLTVPDIDEAVSWFREVMGCSAPLTFGPFSDPAGTFMQDLLGVHPRAVIEQITMIRCGRSASIELFEYDAPDQSTTLPKNSDWAGHHVAFYVDDIDAADRSKPARSSSSARQRSIRSCSVSLVVSSAAAIVSSGLFPRTSSSRAERLSPV